MTSPRLEIRLDRIHHNTRTLVERLAARHIAVTAVTKATLGSPEVGRELLAAGATALGESRIENIERLRRGGITAPITLLRSPMLSQVERVVTHADVSLNTEPAVVAALSGAAHDRDRDHGVVLMVELGDLREGIMPDDLEGVARRVAGLPNIVLRGIGTNLACHSGVAPDATNMGRLSALATSIENALGLGVDLVSGGNSANLTWALDATRGPDDDTRVNDLRLGESLLLGREPLERRPIDGLHTDAVALVGEVIESKVKPSRPWGDVHQAAFGPGAAGDDSGAGTRAIIALGRQDVDPVGLVPPLGVRILGASSDHLVVASDDEVRVGTEMVFGIDSYRALLAAMTSPFVTRTFRR